MKPGRASKTAEHNALFQALESRIPADERLFRDPIAEAFLSWPYRAVALGARVDIGRRLVLRTIDGRWPGVRTAVAARTQLIDELLTASVGDVGQVVILGAGYDTRAWRLEALRNGPALFEVDHPDTQRRKRAMLDRRGLPTTYVNFVPTDFHLERLGAAMHDKGYRASEPTLFLWEGTTNYLDAASVDATVRWCAEAAAGSQLIFTYINEDVLADPSRYTGAARVLDALGRTDEQMTFGLAPDLLGSYLHERGFELMSDVGAAQFRAQAYGDRAEQIRGHEFYRVAHARIPASISARPRRRSQQRR